MSQKDLSEDFILLAEKEVKMTRKSEKKAVIKTATMDHLIDIVEHEGKIGFLMKKDAKLKFVEKIHKNGVIYVPPDRTQIPFVLPRLPEVIKHYEQDNDKSLLIDLAKYHQEISELPDERYYHLLALWVMHTYMLEKIRYSPVICFDGVYEIGKTRTATGMTRVAYRGFPVESVREAHIFRYTKYFAGAMFFDVKDFCEKVKKCGSEDIFLKRFEKGAKVPRIKDFRKQPFDDIVYYEVFGPTIIATNETVNDIFESRGITINLRRSSRDFREITPEFTLPFKERLVAFRARNYKQTLPDIPKPFKGRFGDIVKPLFQIARIVHPESTQILKELLTDIKLAKNYEKSQSREACLLKATWECQKEVKNSLLPISTITSRLRTKSIYFNNKTAANKFRQMGFKTDRTPENTSALVWDKEYLKKQIIDYSVQISPESPDSPSMFGESGATGEHG